ncbi:polysaccharide deacetylase family protein [Longispora fulva]|uniref:Peptidoglycan/xylan/chitin deacetylase (PgdA/CDA1 family) n=1 Tax=Longispora fulva TaxID=619741 RepID=A0A8J7GIQ5_9ACTN|nr:polysaccharide deacetylase family protein [Longispora fulva]MBG6137183.1 peptidoglycan/xylan/chitin deacetylase (PgdA/CDA1 family) [Longispora fulva]
MSTRALALLLVLAAVGTASPARAAGPNGSTPAGSIPAAAGSARAAAGPTGDIVYATRGDGRVLALTFDDGPSPDWTPQVLDLLRQRKVRATFCLLGSQAQAHPDLVRRIVADGHAVCNHTWKHDYLADWTPEAVRADLSATSAAIRAAAGDPALPIRYFRAPYAGWGVSPAVAAELGMTALAWTMDPRDWDGSGAEAITARLRAQAYPTAVALSHDGGGWRQPTLDAYTVMIPEWQGGGWGFDLPAVTGGPYPPACTAPAWRAHDTHVGGDRVSRGGRVYQANWWTTLEDPRTAWWVWSDLGPC